MSSSLLSKEPDKESSELINNLRGKLLAHSITTSEFISNIPYEGRSIEISFLSITQTNPRGVLFFLTGRCDGYEKYLHRPELFIALAKLGLNIYIHDHRGQGLSSRLLLSPNEEADTSKGFVETFSNYAEDAKQFQKIVFQKNQALSDLPKFLLSFSMGAPVALSLLDEEVQSSYSSAVFLAPMFRVEDPFFTYPYHYVTRPYLSAFGYFYGWTDYYDPNTNYAISGSGYRGYKLEEIYNKHSSLQLGGGTYQWVYNAADEFVNKIPYYDIQTPSLVIKAGSDNKVSNAAIDEMSIKKTRIFRKVTTHTINKAPHELLFADLMVKNELPPYIKAQEAKASMKVVNETINRMTRFYKSRLNN